MSGLTMPPYESSSSFSNAHKDLSLACERYESVVVSKISVVKQSLQAQDEVLATFVLKSRKSNALLKAKATASAFVPTAVLSSGHGNGGDNGGVSAMPMSPARNTADNTQQQVSTPKASSPLKKYADPFPTPQPAQKPEDVAAAVEKSPTRVAAPEETPQPAAQAQAQAQAQATPAEEGSKEKASRSRGDRGAADGENTTGSPQNKTLNKAMRKVQRWLDANDFEEPGGGAGFEELALDADAAA
ncbi:hypothetical protein PPROV_000887700 [Pycnococcus provasolii]|uniref:Uncharacterized protein n=1 Tax=Pycnococcus provasolii TaxID=41880 RepID=A0A830HTX7_9CHLO|nr:hypothetical protein PPROV_000887700 [Pycnococcus provasolii]